MPELNKDKPQNLLDLVDRDFEISRGTPLPLGATLKRRGINFSLFSRHATEVSLVLFVPGDKDPIAIFPLDPKFNKTGDIWHIFIYGLESEVEYCFQIDRKPNDKPQIHRFDKSKLLIDPNAHAVTGGEKWGTVPEFRRSFIPENRFKWEDDRQLETPMTDSIIYELHVRGYTKDASSGVEHKGTYLGLIEKIPYLKELGVTAVELLPINEFSETDSYLTNPETGEKLLNFWGYNPVSFFAPKASYAHNADGGEHVAEFKTMVKAFHKAGIEVILDVVFNHTAEGNQYGPTISFKGLDNSIYYIIDKNSGEYLNFTGCGNTLNCNHPIVRDMILACLRYWVIEMHIDGFRFDLASVLGRGQDGSVLTNPPLLERISADPILGKTKLIAEAWDAAGLYQVGSFPSYGRWAEWNASFRDDIRKFVRSGGGMVSSLASKLMGSPDLYMKGDRNLEHGINFITCHDGFTLKDLVSYNEKHNLANGEDNHDGSNDNSSWNCGWEGATKIRSIDYGFEISFEAVDKLRLRQAKNFAALLLLSRGVPMILAGDEFGRTQKGNNNAYCQDNQISWLDWNMADTNNDLLRFFKHLIAFRKRHPSLRNHCAEYDDIMVEFPVNWHGVKPHEPDWAEYSRSLAVQITEPLPENPNEHIDIYIVASSYWGQLTFELPEISGRSWHRMIDTSVEPPDDICDSDRGFMLERQATYVVNPRSVVVLIGY